MQVQISLFRAHPQHQGEIPLAISFICRQARHLHVVLRRAFGNFRSPGLVLGFIVDAEGLRVRVVSADAAIELRAASGEGPQAAPPPEPAQVPVFTLILADK